MDLFQKFEHLSIQQFLKGQYYCGQTVQYHSYDLAFIYQFCHDDWKENPTHLDSDSMHRWNGIKTERAVNSVTQELLFSLSYFKATLNLMTINIFSFNLSKVIFLSYSFMDQNEETY